MRDDDVRVRSPGLLAWRALGGALRGLLYLLVIIWSALPVAFIVLSSLKPQQDIFAFPPTLIFRPTAMIRLLRIVTKKLPHCSHNVT